MVSKPLVSILIPAYNAERTIAETIQSALSQTWPYKEIVVVNDGSTDRTAQIASSFGTAVNVVSTENRGASATRNYAMSLSHGDYIQWLDADDLLLPDKIERQLAARRDDDSRRVLLSSPWARFYYRTTKSHCIFNSLCQDLSPVEWLMRKMSNNLHMQTATWLTSRELIEAAGDWDTRLSADDDGEYFARVLMASRGTRFVPETGVFYRIKIKTRDRLSYIGNSDSKKESLRRSITLHVQYLRSLEESERVRNACMKYLQCWYQIFYPERTDIVADLKNLAVQLGCELEEPRLRRKYAWMRTILGWRIAKRAQNVFPELREALAIRRDAIAYRLERHVSSSKNPANTFAPSILSFEMRARRRMRQSPRANSNLTQQMPLPIPKRIIQIGKDSQFSLRHRVALSNMRLLHPEYDFLYFDNRQKDDFVRREFPQYHAVYENFKFPIQRYDFFRYLVVYRYGGFYFDLDVLLAECLSPLLELSCVFPFEAISTSRILRDKFRMDWQIGNYAFGAAPGHVFLEAIIDNCVRSQKDPNLIKQMMRGAPPFLNDEFYVINSTGPGIVSLTFAENPEIAASVAILFPDDISDVSTWNQFGTFGIHLMDGSWRRSKGYIHQKLVNVTWGRIQRRNVVRSREDRKPIY